MSLGGQRLGFIRSEKGGGVTTNEGCLETQRRKVPRKSRTNIKERKDVKRDQA